MAKMKEVRKPGRSILFQDDDGDSDGRPQYDSVLELRKSEIDLGTDPTMIDTDLDNLNDAFEIKLGTDPLDDDTYGDLSLDGIEVASGTDPLDDRDYPSRVEPQWFEDPMTISLLLAAIGGVIVVSAVILVKKRNTRT